MRQADILDDNEIILPNDANLKRRLIAKLEEYRKRVVPSPCGYKIIVLERLLTEGRVNRDILQNELESKHGFDWACFRNGFYVIWAYANKREDLLYNSSGLPR